MFRGEFESMSLFYKLAPDFVVKPLAWGRCPSAADVHFFISEFHDMRDEQPDVETFCAKVAEMHLKSTEMHRQKSCNPQPEGNFGFHVTTHLGNFPHDNTWCDSWEEFYIQNITRVLAFEERTQGSSTELRELAIQMIEKVIPRLLRPLETGGRKIMPTLIHGDLSIKNVKKDVATERLIMYDAGTFWAHNECMRFMLFRAFIDIKQAKLANGDQRDSDWAGGIWRRTTSTLQNLLQKRIGKTA
jgi:protein-ribulosamine 3-kinase